MWSYQLKIDEEREPNAATHQGKKVKPETIKAGVRKKTACFTYIKLISS